MGTRFSLATCKNTTHDMLWTHEDLQTTCNSVIMNGRAIYSCTSEQHSYPLSASRMLDCHACASASYTKRMYHLCTDMLCDVVEVPRSSALHFCVHDISTYVEHVEHACGALTL